MSGTSGVHLKRPDDAEGLCQIWNTVTPEIRMVPLIALMPVLPTLSVDNSPFAHTVMLVFVVATVTSEVQYYLPYRGPTKLSLFEFNHVTMKPIIGGRRVSAI